MLGLNGWHGVLLMESSYPIAGTGLCCRFALCLNWARCLHYLSRAGGTYTVPINIGVIDIHRILAYYGWACIIAVSGSVNNNRLVSGALNHLSTRTVVVMPVTSTSVIVVHELGAADVDPIAGIAIPMVVPTGFIHIVRLYKYPPVVGAVVIVASIEARAQRCPTAISPTPSPTYPSGSPLIAGNPYPTVVAIVGPAAIVVASPTPRVIRDPSVSIFRHHPAATGIGSEVLIFVGNENITELRIVYPLAIRCQIVVERLVRNRYVLSLSPVCRRSQEQCYQHG